MEGDPSAAGASSTPVEELGIALPVTLTCPRDHSTLAAGDGCLSCERGHRYPVVEGVPVLLLDEVAQTMPLSSASLARAQRGLEAADMRAPHLYLESLGITEAEKELAVRLAAGSEGSVDPAVSVLVGATSGYAYRHLVGCLREYPIPQIRMAPGRGELLLDVGCSWGRWSLAAARSGYRVVGIDPSLGAVMAARRVARSLGVAASFAVADARFMPFPPASFDRVFSYSVIQHFAPSDADRCVSEIGRVLRDDGRCLVQMAHRVGIRSLYHQARRRFRQARGFEVRYRGFSDLSNLFASRVGPTSLSVDCYFGLGLQASDRGFLSWYARPMASSSDLLRRLSQRAPALRYVADSLYVESRREARRGAEPKRPDASS